MEGEGGGGEEVIGRAGDRTAAVKGVGKEGCEAPMEGRKENGKARREELRTKERAGSLSIIEYLRKENNGEGESARIKRKREDDTEMKEKEGDLIGILREIRAEIREMKEKMSGWEEGWRLKEKKIEEKLDKMEERLMEVEKRNECGKAEEEGGKMEELIERVAEEMKRKYDITESQNVGEDRFSIKEVNQLKKWVSEREKEERKNNIAIKGVIGLDEIKD